MWSVSNSGALKSETELERDTHNLYILVASSSSLKPVAFVAVPSEPMWLPIWLYVVCPELSEPNKEDAIEERLPRSATTIFLCYSRSSDRAFLKQMMASSSFHSAFLGFGWMNLCFTHRPYLWQPTTVLTMKLNIGHNIIFWTRLQSVRVSLSISASPFISSGPISPDGFANHITNSTPFLFPWNGELWDSAKSINMTGDFMGNLHNCSLINPVNLMAACLLECLNCAEWRMD